MSRLLCHGLLRLACRGLSSGSNSVFIEFLHCFFGHFGQLCLLLGPLFQKFLTTLDASGISFLAWCQWRSWAWRVYGEFLHVLRSHISVLPPFFDPSLYPLNAYLALIFVLLALSGHIRSAIFIIYVIRDFKSSIRFWSLSSLLRSFTISHILHLRILNTGIF